MKSVFTGDAVFSLGCGRLFEGSPNEMWKSICKIKSLPDDTNIFCGHEYTMNNAIFTKSIIDNEMIDLKIREIKKLRSNNIPTIPTTIEEEKKLNIFFQADRDEIKSLFSTELINDEEAFKMIRLAKDDF
jgi:hydroxyacylglutathione hydrolase